MLKNYLRIAWRNLRNNKIYSFINITGLAAGMAIALLIGLWITDELSFDHYYTDHARLAKVMVTSVAQGHSYTGSVVQVPLGEALRTQFKDDFRRVALTAYRPGPRLVTTGEKKLYPTVLYAQPDFPVMFGYRMVSGSVDAFRDPSSVLIAQSLAAALFGKADPVGATIRLDNDPKLAMKVGGVFEDLPANTSFHDVQALLPWYNQDNVYLNTNTTWGDHNSQLYVQLADHTTAEQATAKITHLPTPYFKSWKETALVYPIDKAHLYNLFKDGRPDGGFIEMVWLFGIIGMFVLLLACINFMNLSTARSQRRAREVGIRKTLGSLRPQLVIQFLSESLLTSMLAFVLALLLVSVSLPFFNQLAAKQIMFPWTSPLFWTSAAAFILLTALLAGSYPAFYLSGFDPVRVLKGVFKAGRFAALPRQSLVVLQFVVSLTLIIGTVVVYRQIQYAKDRPTGYSREGLVTVDLNTPDLYTHYDALRADLLRTGAITNMEQSSYSVTSFNSNNPMSWRGQRPDQQSIMFRNVNVGRDFGKTINWSLLQGRDFSRTFATDSDAIILNDAAVKAIGIPHPVGETVQFGGKNYIVIGVVSNMLTQSPYDTIIPSIFLGDGYRAVITMRVNPAMPMQQALAAVAPIFGKYNPGSPFLYHFVDEEYARKFAVEQRIGSLSAVFTVLAIFISCLGLFGLASFVAEQRTKEIGVRKVLGAGIITLWGLLSKEFVRLAVLSLIFAVPLSYWMMDRWLKTYTYRSGLPWWIFAAAGAGILLITLATVSYQSLKAATMNPTKSLRSE